MNEGNRRGDERMKRGRSMEGDDRRRKEEGEDSVGRRKRSRRGRNHERKPGIHQGRKAGNNNT
jgi:hypothetical protein